MLLDNLQKRGLISPPKFLVPNTHYLTQMGSVSYGVSNDESDIDVVGFCMPPKETVFPHLAGSIVGFGVEPYVPFKPWQKHHIVDPDKRTAEGQQVQYDITVYGIVQFFQLCMENNPNMVDAIFTPQRCILHATPVAQMMRDDRRVFLHKGSYPKFKGYAYSQLKKLKEKKQSENPKRAASIAAFGYDVKAAYHVVRLALECEMILTTGTLDLEANREQLKAIRRGEWTLDYLDEWFQRKEIQLEQAKTDSKLPDEPNEDAIKALLMRCLEQHYGSLEKAVVQPTDAAKILAEMQAVIDRHSRGL